jgi:putative redox protein
LSVSRLRAGADADEAAFLDDSIEMTLIATARSVPGTFRQDVLIDGQHHITTDEPERLGGEGRGPAPHELLPAALAACISATLGAYGRTKGWDLGDIAVDVEYDNKSVPRHFDISIGVTGNVDDPQLARLRKVAAACPLRRSLEAGFEFDERLGRRRPVALTRG